MATQGIFFPEQILTPQGLGAFGSATLTDGILAGCDISISGDAATVGAGFVICGGRVFQTDATSWAVNGANYTVVYARVNTSGVSTEESFDQATVSAVNASSVATAYSIMNHADASYPDTDINVNGTGEHTTWLALIQYEDGTPRLRAVNRSASGRVKLWENAAPTAAFVAQTVSLPNMAGLNSFAVKMRRSTSASTAQEFVFDVSDDTSETFSADSVIVYDSSQSEKTVFRTRNVTIKRGSGEFDFSSCWKDVSGGTKGQDDSMMIPVEIYGSVHKSGV